ncbi:hypothetical protein P3X46_018336 [Hevea brasiliensis]|uniref:SAWADEE domain-containing protein n=1 Tax=Hevea brasiliensis TaxID=3981 RepID=A0ABQ9LSK8_HEVBR|nr:hypothetical protein P3X46_018336 [Hevea brasiliensis]
MGRPPSNGALPFASWPGTKMEGILQEHHNSMPAREVLVALAEKFRRYAMRAKSSKAPVKLNVTLVLRGINSREKCASTHSCFYCYYCLYNYGCFFCAGRVITEVSYIEFKAKSARDGAWYDVGTFLSHGHLDTGDLIIEVLFRFAGFGPDEDEWVNIRKHVRQRSLPCEASEWAAVLPGELILCFQEIVPLRKVCCRPETDYRLQQLHAANDVRTSDQHKTSMDPSTTSIQSITVSAAKTMHKQQNADVVIAGPVSHANTSLAAQKMIPEPKSAGTSNTVNVGNLTVAPSSTLNAESSGVTPSRVSGGSD